MTEPRDVRLIGVDEALARMDAILALPDICDCCGAQTTEPSEADEDGAVYCPECEPHVRSQQLAERERNRREGRHYDDPR